MNPDDMAGSLHPESKALLAQIDNLPNELQLAWEVGSRLDLPDWPGIRQVILCGVGDSAVGADLLLAYGSPFYKQPVVLWKDYNLPAWAAGPETLVMALSHQWNDEVTLAAFEQAGQRHCRRLAIGMDGALTRQAQEASLPAMLYPAGDYPVEPLGWLFGLPAAALFRLGLLPDIGAQVAEAVAAMRSQQASIRADVPPNGNPARRMAGQMMGRWVTITGSDVLAPVARHWKSRLGGVARSWAQSEALPEMDYTMLSSVHQPDGMLSATMIVFLRAGSEHPRNRLRCDLTKRYFMLEGLGTDFVDAEGQSALAHQWTCLHFGEYAAFYLAEAYGIDPKPTPVTEQFHQELAAGSRPAR
jgi:glucose/mannose-6-phosphate isomerase